MTLLLIDPTKMCVLDSSRGREVYTTQSSKGIYSTKYIIDGYVYYIKCVSDATPPVRWVIFSNSGWIVSTSKYFFPKFIRYVRCVDYKRFNCAAVGVVLRNGEASLFRQTRTHNHAPDVVAAGRVVFLDKLERAVYTAPDILPLENIYSELALRYPMTAKEIPFLSVYQKMRKWRLDK